MELSDLNELELSNIGEWPVPAKVVLVLALCAAIGYAWYYFITSRPDRPPRQGRAEGAQAARDLRGEAGQGRQPGGLRAAARGDGGVLRRHGAPAAGPDRGRGAAGGRVADRAGRGLEFELFQPSGEQNKDFYAELPIRMRVNGRYHEFGRFISGLAALPRIVTIHDVKISPAAATPGRPVRDVRLSMEATVKTYRYLEEAAVQ
jgi:type IV pilus assembly protein PilO